MLTVFTFIAEIHADPVLVNASAAITACIGKLISFKFYTYVTFIRFHPCPCNTAHSGILLKQITVGYIKSSVIFFYALKLYQTVFYQFFGFLGGIRSHRKAIYNSLSVEVFINSLFIPVF